MCVPVGNMGQAFNTDNHKMFGQAFKDDGLLGTKKPPVFGSKFNGTTGSDGDDSIR